MVIKFIAILCMLSLTMGMSKLDCEIKGCQSCRAPNVCELCSENYVMHQITGFEGRFCLRAICPDNCQICNQVNECGTCSLGFELSSEGLCQESEGLLKSVKQTLRILSEGNYTSGNQTNGNQTTDNQTKGNCTTVPGCMLCPQSSICAKCKPNYSKNGRGICISCSVPNCHSCSIPDVCDKCDPQNTSLALSIFGDKCLVCDKSTTGLGCLSCSDTNICGLCSNGFQLVLPQVAAAVCVKCQIPNCRRCGVKASTTICQRCNFGYSPSPTQQSCIQCLFPCDTCTESLSPNNCATCSTPFFFKKANADGTCNKKLIAGCEQVDTANSSKCIKCEAGYNLESTSDSTKCLWFCPENCIACTNAQTCNLCAIGFAKKPDGKCLRCEAKGCAICEQNGVDCKTCMRGFYDDKMGECKKCPGFCADCTSSMTCQELVMPRFLVLILINGQSMMAVCDSACITCSNRNPEICLQCAEGHFLKNGKCKKCRGGCMTCDQSSPSTCLSCFPSNFLTGSSCTTCSSNCMSCASASAPDSCTSCWDGFYLNGTECVQGCPENCFSCFSATTCVECLSGYTLFNDEGTLTCAPCISSCRTCAEGQPSECLACGEGFYLTGSTCTPCVDNCAECNAAGCMACAEDFFMTSEQTCAANCILPCATCKASDPTACLSCAAGYRFDDIQGACVQVLTCASGCVACPMGYSLKDAACLICSTSNCQSCNVDNLTECYSCKPTYYLTDGGSCSTCPDQCRTCLSETGCLTCAAGYTKKKNGLLNFGGSQCVKCNAPCATCAFTPNNCRSCVSGFKFFGWKCGQRFRFTFKIKLMVRLVFFNRNFFSLIKLFARAMKGSNNAITCDKITEGSVDLEGSAAPSGAEGSSDSADQLKALNDLIRGGELAGMAVGEASVTIEGGEVGTVSSSQTTSWNQTLSIILGICIPIGVLIIVGVIVLCVYKRREGQKVQDVDYHDSNKDFGNQESEDRYDTRL